jgi:hypothetical protein
MLTRNPTTLKANIMTVTSIDSLQQQREIKFVPHTKIAVTIGRVCIWDGSRTRHSVKPTKFER